MVCGSGQQVFFLRIGRWEWFMMLEFRSMPLPKRVALTVKESGESNS